MCSASQQPSATPILDRVVPLPAAQTPEVAETNAPVKGSRRTLWFALAFLLLPVLWIASMVWVPGVSETSSRLMEPIQRILDSVGESLLSGRKMVSVVFWLAIIPFLAFCLAVVVHELGHLIAGWCMGFRFVSIRFGPLEITRGFRLSLSGRETPRAGATRMTLETTHWARTRHVIYALGGVLANLLIAFWIVCFEPFPSPFAGFFAILSIGLGVGNLIPMQREGTISDGKRIIMALSRDGESQRAMQLLRVTAAVKSGVALEDLPADQISAIIAWRDASALTVAAHVLAYSASWNKGPDSETARRIEVALQFSPHAPPRLREMIVSTAGVFQAGKKKNVVLARQWLADISEKPLCPDSGSGSRQPSLRQRRISRKHCASCGRSKPLCPCLVPERLL